MKTITMKKIKSRALAAVAGFAWGVLALAPAYASDTEVYSRRVEVSGDAAPVMMMVLDTSSSMLNCMSTNTTTCAAGEKSRVATLVGAFQKVLFGDPNEAKPVKPAPGYLRLGYSRFNPNNNKMGWVRYPADKKLDDTSTRTDTGLPYSGTAAVNVAASAFDATGTTTNATSFYIGSAGGTGGTLTVPATPDVGIQFSGVTVPRNATITSATITFTEEEVVTSALGTVSLQAAAEDPTHTGLNGVDYSTKGVNDATRTYMATLHNAAYSGGVITVTNAVADAVADSDWCEGDTLALKIKSTGVPTKKGSTWYPPDIVRVRSFDGAGAGGVPRLNISYTLASGSLATTCALKQFDVVKSIRDGESDAILDDVEWAWGGTRVVHDNSDMRPAGITTLTAADGTVSTVRNVVAVRFEDVDVPQGSVIDKAWLYVTGYYNKETGPSATVAVDAFNVDNLSPFCTRNTTTRLVSCSKPSEASMTPVVDTFTFPKAGNTTSDADVYLVDVTEAVKTVVNRGSWAEGNAMGFRLYNNDSGTTTVNKLAVAAVEASPSRGMILHIIYKKSVTNLNSIPKTVRQDLAEDMAFILSNNLGSQSSLGATVFETAKYMLGKPAEESDTVVVGGKSIDLAETAALDPTAAEPTYKSPVGTGSECSANYLYVLTDGVPNDASGVTDHSSDIFEDAPDPDSATCEPNTAPLSGGNNQKNYSCMMGVAKAMATSNTSLGKEIRTNTVLFGPALSPTDKTSDLYKTRVDLSTIAQNYGSGRFYDANSETALMQSLLDTLSALIDVSGTITAPGVAVNQFNRLTHLDQLYYAVFDPQTEQSRWLGNVKRYRLEFIDTTVPVTTTTTVTNDDGTTTTTSTTTNVTRQTAEIRDMNNVNAVNSNTGFFKVDAQSYWSAQVDGDKAFEGGVAKRLPAPADRKIYTNVTNAASLERITSTVPTAAASVALSGLSGLNTTQFNNLRNWILGYNIDIVTEAAPPTIPTAVINKTTQGIADVTQRNQLGGVLHSQPVLVNYGYTGSLSTVQDNPDQQKNVLFFSDMEGMLHAVNAKQNASDDGGEEIFAFLPRETLQKMDEIALNGLGATGPDGQRVPEFGLDSTWTVLRVDGDKDQIIDPDGDGGDKVWIFAGMRMGGSTYYALDVTDPEDPDLLWTKSPANGGPWANLGQTWSKPVLGDIKVGTTVKKVLFIAGGYDDDHEKDTAYDPTTDASDEVGNQVYIVDPETGSVIAWASNAGTGTEFKQVDAMDFSIPSELKLFDTNKDGLTDAVYFGDLGGQVFRMDINNGATNAALIHRVQLIAQVSEPVSGSNADRRRFYEAPSVATMLDSDTNDKYVAIAMGSGSRSHPLDTGTNDYFYVFKDRDVLRSDLLTMADADLQATLTSDDLPVVVPVTHVEDDGDPLTDDTVAATLKTGVTNTNGWRLSLLEDGEKVLATSLILFGEVFFTSYIPDEDSGSSCAPVIGRSKLWRMGVAKGEVTIDFNGDGVIDEKDRYLDNVVQGLGGAPQLIVGADGKNAVLTGTGVTRNKDLNPPGMTRTRWYEKK